MIPPITIFISYAREDALFRESLSKHLAGLRRSGKATIWSDNLISPGLVWDEVTKEHLRKADIVALLLSDDFLDSDYIWENELKESLDRREKGEAVMLVPILIRPCVISNTILANIQMLPRNQLAVSSYANQDLAWYQIAVEIDALVDNFQKIITSNIPYGDKQISSKSDRQILGTKNVISGSIIIVGGNLHIGDIENRLSS